MKTPTWQAFHQLWFMQSFLKTSNSQLSILIIAVSEYLSLIGQKCTVPGSQCHLVDWDASEELEVPRVNIVKTMPQEELSITGVCLIGGLGTETKKLRCRIYL